MVAWRAALVLMLTRQTNTGRARECDAPAHWKLDDWNRHAALSLSRLKNYKNRPAESSFDEHRIDVTCLGLMGDLWLDAWISFESKREMCFEFSWSCARLPLLVGSQVCVSNEKVMIFHYDNFARCIIAFSRKRNVKNGRIFPSNEPRECGKS